MNLNIQYAAQIPSGCWRNGEYLSEARLRPLRGQDEAFLLDAGEALTAPQRVTALLARCILRLGVEQEITPEIVRNLTVGDREALLLHLRRITYGDRLPCLLSCASVSCGERLDLELNVNELLLPPHALPRKWHEISLMVGEKNYQVRLRVPNGLDQELVAQGSWSDLKEAENFLLQRCVETVSTEDRSSIPMEDWSAELADRIGNMMSELDPQAEILLVLQCPVCRQSFTGEFDAGAYLYQELCGHIPYLYREVHQMARSYHWSEAEILRMTPRKRSVYLNLLAGEDVLG
jgi:hypothetical protein